METRDTTSKKVELLFYSREGNVDCIQCYESMEAGVRAISALSDPESAEWYSRIALTSFDPASGKRALISELTF